MSVQEFIPAATLILFRDGGNGTAELLLIERNALMAFAAGALVFPGGRVDPGDRLLAEEKDGDPLIDTARIAAIRETIEEVGIAIGLTPPPTGPAVRAIRAGLAAGEPFGRLLAEHRLSVDREALTVFARWRPNMRETRNFDTFFFVAAAPADAVASPDGGESVRAIWSRAADVLTEAAAGRCHVIFPTRRNLERLALLPDIAAARAHAAAHPVEAITPWFEERDGEQWLCIPQGRGYPVTAERRATARRG